MEGTRALWLLVTLLLRHINADLSIPTLELNQTTKDHTNFLDKDNNGTRADCLVDTEMGVIAISSAGGLIFCLVIATVVLACQLYHIRRQVYSPQASHSNMYLVSSTDYWDTHPPAIEGLDGPCDTSVMLEEVTADNTIQEENEVELQREEEGAMVETEQEGKAFNPEASDGQMLSSDSKDLSGNLK